MFVQRVGDAKFSRTRGKKRNQKIKEKKRKNEGNERGKKFGGEGDIRTLIDI